MNDEPDTIVLNVLKRLQEGQSRLESGQRTTNERLAAIEHHLAAFHVSLTRSNDDYLELNSRVNRIERRLDLVDDEI